MTSPKIVVNEENDQQDIHRVREEKLSRPWYRFAEELLVRFPATEYPKLLDVGGGAGEFAKISRSHGYTTTLVDGNPTSVEREKDRGFSAHQADFNFPLDMIEDDSYDVAISLEVIEHIVQAEHLISEVYKKLRPGGVYIISTPNFSFLKDRLDYLRGKNALSEGYHFRFYTKESLNKIVEQAGFEIVARNSIGTALGVNFILRIISLGRIRLNRFRTPDVLETLLARTFVIAARKNKK